MFIKFIFHKNKKWQPEITFNVKKSLVKIKILKNLLNCVLWEPSRFSEFIYRIEKY